MLKRLLVFTVLLATLLSACAQSSQPGEVDLPPTSPPAAAVRATSTTAPQCIAQAAQPTPNPTLQAIFPPINANDRTMGPQDAPVTLIEYCDYQSALCAEFAPELARLAEEFGESLRIAYRHYPQLLGDFYKNSRLAAQAAEAAGLQGQFWGMHNLLYENQAAWSSLSEEAFQSWLVEQAQELDLETEQFIEDLNSAELVALANDAWERNSAYGIPGEPYLPYLVLDGLPYGGPKAYGDLAAVVRTLLLSDRQFAECPPMALDASKQYFATLHTEKGDVVIELYAEEAPLAVNSFIFLARQGWFDGVTFHRVIPGFVAQGGDPSGTGMGGPGYIFDNEISPNLAFDGPGVVAMANSGPGTNGSQFFITYTATPHLHGGYTIFGRVIKGMQVVESLTPRDPSQSMELPLGDKILSVTIEEK